MKPTIKLRSIKQIKQVFVLTSFAILVVLILFSPSWATTYYVDATKGNDSNPGTSESAPWKTIAKVNSSSFQPRDNILLKRGEAWREQLTISSSGLEDSPIVFGAYGIGGKPKISGSNVIKGWSKIAGAYNTTVLAQVKIVYYNDIILTEKDGASYDVGFNEWDYNSVSNMLFVNVGENPDNGMLEASIRNFSIDINNRDYITVEKVDVVNARLYGIVVRNGSKNIIVQDCDAYKNAATGITANGTLSACDEVVFRRNKVYLNKFVGIGMLEKVDNLTIEENEIFKNGYTKEFALGGGMYLKSGILGAGPRSENLLVQDNYSHDNGPAGSTIIGTGIYLDQVGDNAIVRFNIAKNNTGSGFIIEHSDNAQIHYNLSYGNGGNGFQVIRGSTNTKLYNNVAYNNKRGIEMNHIKQGGFDNNQVINNIMFENTLRGLCVSSGAANDGINGSGNVYSNNCLGEEASGFIHWGSKIFNTYEEWESAYGIETNSIKFNPLFVDSNKNNFNLKLESPCIDTGQNVGLEIDFNRTLLPQDRGYDIGAFESKNISPPINFRIESTTPE